MQMVMLTWGYYMRVEKELKKITTNLNNALKLVQVKEIKMLNIILKTIVSKSR